MACGAARSAALHNPKGEETVSKKIEVLHPITHSGTIFGRGLHELDDALAGSFLKLKDPVSREPIARVPEEKSIPAGNVEPDPSAENPSSPTKSERKGKK